MFYELTVVFLMNICWLEGQQKCLSDFFLLVLVEKQAGNESEWSLRPFIENIYMKYRWLLLLTNTMKNKVIDIRLLIQKKMKGRPGSLKHASSVCRVVASSCCLCAAAGRVQRKSIPKKYVFWRKPCLFYTCSFNLFSAFILELEYL